MKAIYFDMLPQDAEARKETDPGNYTIMGASVFTSEFFRALLRHSQYDRILVPSVPKPVTGDLRDSELFQKNSSRVELMTEQMMMNLSSSRQYDQLVFMARAMDLASLARLRRISGYKRAPIVGVIHSLNYAWQLRSIMMLLVARLNRFDAMVCSSSAGKETMNRFLELLAMRQEKCGLPGMSADFKMPIIPLGVETDSFAGCAENDREILALPDGPTLLYFGRFSPTSKADLFPLIIAFRQILDEHPKATLVLAGDDTHHRMAQQMQQLADSLHMTEHVRVVANPDLATKIRLYRAADVFVSPSDSLQETFGIALVEAMAAGLPCIVSDWDGYKDIVVEGETGFRVPTTLPIYPPLFDDLRGSGAMKNVDLLAATTIVDWKTFSSRISTLLSNADLRKRMGEAAKKRAQSLYDWRTVIATYEALWNGLATEAANLNGIAEKPSLDLDSFSYHDIFSHYATNHLSANRLIVASSAKANQELSITILKDTLPWFQEEVFRSIARIVNEVGPTRFGELISALGTSNELQTIVHIAHVSRMIKYGFLNLED